MPLISVTPQSNNTVAKSLSGIVIKKLSVDITLSESQKDSIAALFNRAQVKANSIDVKDSVFSKEIKLSRQLVMDSILTPEQLQIIKIKNEERKQAFIRKSKLNYKK